MTIEAMYLILFVIWRVDHFPSRIISECLTSNDTEQFVEANNQ